MDPFLSEPGLFIGMAIVLVATIFLPARVRWYVLTAGIAVALTRAYQVFWAQKSLRKLDKVRGELRGQLSDLRARNVELEEIYAQLTQELKTIKAERQLLLGQREALNKLSKNYAKDLEALDLLLEQKKQESMALVEQGKPILAYLEKFAAAERLSANTPEHL